MERQGMKWQIIVGALLLVVLVSSLFFPVFKVTGDRYISAVLDVNTYAEKQNLSMARDAGTKEITDKYQKNTSKRKEKAGEFDKEIKKGSDSISGIRFIKWAFAPDKIDFPGVVFAENKDIGNSGVKTIFRMMGLLLLFPIFLGICNLVFMLVRRKTYSAWLAVTGLCTVVCDMIFWKGMPGMIWTKSSPYIRGFTMISDKTLLIKGTGKYAMQSMVTEFLSVSLYAGLISGGVLLAAGILFMTVLKPGNAARTESRQVPVQDQWDTAGEVTDLKTQWQDFKGGADLSEDNGPEQNPGAVTNMKLKGKIYGIKGEYKGCEMEIAEGEEIVLGRDPKYCGLVFSHEQVSRKHCGIRYDGEKRKYQVIDYSTNGTVFENGGMAKAGMYTSVPSGTVLLLAGGEEKIKLGRGRYGNAPNSNMR